MKLPKFQFDQKIPKLKTSKIIDEIEYTAEIEYMIASIVIGDISDDAEYTYILIPKTKPYNFGRNMKKLSEKEMEEFISNPESFVKKEEES